MSLNIVLRVYFTKYWPFLANWEQVPQSLILFIWTRCRYHWCK